MPHRVELQRGNDPNVCPLKALEDFIFLRGRAVGPLFSTPVGMPYTATAAREDLSSVLSFCGLDNKRYKSHSSGSAQLLTRPSGASRTPR